MQRKFLSGGGISLIDPFTIFLTLCNQFLNMLKPLQSLFLLFTGIQFCCFCSAGSIPCQIHKIILRILSGFDPCHLEHAHHHSHIYCRNRSSKI